MGKDFKELKLQRNLRIVSSGTLNENPQEFEFYLEKVIEVRDILCLSV